MYYHPCGEEWNYKWSNYIGISLPPQWQSQNVNHINFNLICWQENSPFLTFGPTLSKLTPCPLPFAGLP